MFEKDYKKNATYSLTTAEKQRLKTIAKKHNISPSRLISEIINRWDKVEVVFS